MAPHVENERWTVSRYAPRAGLVISCEVEAPHPNGKIGALRPGFPNLPA